MNKDTMGEISGLEQEGNWEKLEITVDSGAIDHVLPPNKATKFEIKETAASKNGRNFTAANGSTIKNYGAKEVKGKTDKGTDATIVFQVAGVTKPLGAVRRLTKAGPMGNRVVFDEDGSYIEDKRSGQRTTIVDTGKDYIVEMWVEKKEDRENECNAVDAGTEDSGVKWVFNGLEDELI